MSHLAVVFKLDGKGFNLRRGASVLVVALVPLHEPASQKIIPRISRVKAG